jgi:hypothetical protein
VPLTLPAPSSATVATTTGAATAAGKTRGARRGRHRTGKDAYSFLWLPPQSGFFPLRLHVQKNALPFFSALYSIGSKGGHFVRFIAKRLVLGAPACAPPVDLTGLDFDRNRRAAADFRIAHVAPPPSVASQASPQAFANSRTRKM